MIPILLNIKKMSMKDLQVKELNIKMVILQNMAGILRIKALFGGYTELLMKKLK